MITAQKSYKFGKRPDWYSDRSLYVGTVPWVGIHAVDWIYHFCGKRFLSVNTVCVGSSPEMSAVSVFEMEGGIIASANIDYYRPGGAPTHGDDRIRCVGTKGVIEVKDGRVTLITDEGEKILNPSDAPNLLCEFLEGREPISCEEIFYITKVSLLARDSADMKMTLNVEE